MSRVAARRIEGKRKQPAKSKAFRSYLYDPVFVFPNEKDSYSRSDIARLTESPCVLAARRLFTALHDYGIDSPARLYTVGLASLLRCRGIGERAAWVATVLVGNSGYNVDTFCDRKSQTLSLKGRIHLVHSRTRKQKH